MNFLYTNFILEKNSNYMYEAYFSILINSFSILSNSFSILSNSFSILSNNPVIVSFP